MAATEAAETLPERPRAAAGVGRELSSRRPAKNRTPDDLGEAREARPRRQPGVRLIL